MFSIEQFWRKRTATKEKVIAHDDSLFGMFIYLDIYSKMCFFFYFGNAVRSF